jgi:putative ABC transport system permease protein
MFFNQIRRNSLRSRKENSLFFGSLVIAIVVFYVFLSLESQDVITFLKTLESDAIRKLLVLIPIVYAISLFFVFFLVYFANKYQLQRRSHEFGLYQTLGMKRRRIFSMLMGETVWNSLIALLIGIPVALFLTELISLATANLVGLGIIGHHFRVSWTGLIGTVGGFFGVQLIAMFLLSLSMSLKEPIDLLRDETEGSQLLGSKKSGWIHLILGVILLLIAYAMGLFLLKTLYYLYYLAVIGILVTGISGTLLLFRGIATFIGHRVRKNDRKSTGLATFTGRQLQENVLHQSAFLAIGSLLILMAVICLAYGVSSVFGEGRDGERTVDISLQGEQQVIEEVLNSKEIAPYIYAYYPMNLDTMDWDIVENGQGYSWGTLIEAIEDLPYSSSKENLLEILPSHSPFLFPLSSYNALLASMDQPEITLEPGELVLYNSDMFSQFQGDLQMALRANPVIELDGQTYSLASEIRTENLVADRFISIIFGLVVPDDLYTELTNDQEPFCWNVTLDPDFVEDQGLMQALMQVGELLDETNLTYESYLSGIGRQLFYIVAGSYVTLYLGLLFLIIANTVLGLKFLMQQRSTRHRYETLLVLGAKKEALYSSVKKQVWIYFALIISVAIVNSIFGVRSLMNSFLRLGDAASNSMFILLSTIAVVVFLMTELGYIWLIQSESKREIRRISSLDRG